MQMQTHQPHPNGHLVLIQQSLVNSLHCPLFLSAMIDLFVYKLHSKDKDKYMMGSLKRKKCVNVMVLL